MHVACCQFDIVWEDKRANFARVEAMVARAALPPGTLLLLPEMFATGFSMNARENAEDIDGPTAAFLADLAARHRIHVLGGLPTSGKDDRKPQNEALLFNPQGVLASRYAKMQLFALTGESSHYHPGTARCVFELDDFRCQAAICYDLRFPELFRQTPVAEVILLIANWPVVREMHWRALLLARAIENQAYVVAVNRCGADPVTTYPGRSQIVGPKGDLIADAGEGECVIQAELRTEIVRDYRKVFPALDDAGT